MGAITIPAGSNSPDAERLHNATTISDDTFAVSNVIVLSFILISLGFALFSLPWTFFRLQHAGWLTGFRLSSKQPAPMPTKHRVLPGRLYPDTDVDLPRRIGRLPLALPTYIIPFINLSVPQAFLLVITTLVVLLASFVGSNALTDSTRTGYVAVTIVPCVIMLGNKVFGLGTILQVGYASVSYISSSHALFPDNYFDARIQDKLVPPMAGPSFVLYCDCSCRCLFHYLRPDSLDASRDVQILQRSRLRLVCWILSRFLCIDWHYPPKMLASFQSVSPFWDLPLPYW